MAEELRDILPDFVHQMAFDLFNESFSPWWKEYLAKYGIILFMLTEIAMLGKKEEEEIAVRYVREYLDSREISDEEEDKDIDWLHFHLSRIIKRLRRETEKKGKGIKGVLPDLAKRMAEDFENEDLNWLEGLALYVEVLGALLTIGMEKRTTKRGKGCQICASLPKWFIF
ncbi:MAG: hypothetical protein JHC21_02685 [Thermocrinis sp.]|nr:hypothetical protein [Thermocrinis sp.]